MLLVCSLIYITCLSTGAPRDVTAPELQEEWGMVQSLVMSIRFISQFLNLVPRRDVMAPELQEVSLYQFI